MIAVVDVWLREPGRYTLLLPAAQLEAVVDQFRRHRVSDQVVWSEDREEHTSALFFAPQGNTETPFSGQNDRVITSRCKTIEVEHGPGWPLRVPNRLVRVRIEDLPEWMDYCASQKARWIGTSELDDLRIRSGWPLCGLDVTAEQMPLDVGLDQTVSFLKGCFLGSDVLNWIAQRGHPNYQWSQIEFSTPLEGRGPYKVMSGEQVVGTITSWTRASVNGTWTGLGCVRSAPGMTLEETVIDTGGDRVQCHIRQLTPAT